MERYLIVHYYEDGFDVLAKTDDHEHAIEERNQYVVEFATYNIAIYCKVDFAESTQIK